MNRISDFQLPPPKSNITHTNSTPKSNKEEFIPEDTLFGQLYRLGVVDLNGNLHEKFRNTPLPSLSQYSIDQMDEVLSEAVTCGASPRASEVLAHIFEESITPVKVEIVGGYLRYLILTDSTLIGSIQKQFNLSLTHHPSHVFYPIDCDIRCTPNESNAEKIIDLVYKIIEFVKTRVGKDFEYRQSISKKESYYFDGFNKYGVITFNGSNKLKYEFLMIEALKRKSLFVQDAIRWNFEKRTLESDYGLQPIIDILTKTIHIDEAKEIDHNGWPMLMLYYSKGYTSPEKEAEEQLLETSSKFDLQVLLAKCLKNHHEITSATVISLHFNASVSLGMDKTRIASLWQALETDQTHDDEDLFQGIYHLIKIQGRSFESVLASMQIYARLHLHLGTKGVKLVRHHGKIWVQIKRQKAFLLFPYNYEVKGSDEIIRFLIKCWPLTRISLKKEYRKWAQVDPGEGILSLPLMIISQDLEGNPCFLQEICLTLPHYIENELFEFSLSLLANLYGGIFDLARTLPRDDFKKQWIMTLAASSELFMCKLAPEMFYQNSNLFKEDEVIELIEIIFLKDPIFAWNLLRKIDSFDLKLYFKVRNGLRAIEEGRVYLSASLDPIEKYLEKKDIVRFFLKELPISETTHFSDRAVSICKNLIEKGSDLLLAHRLMEKFSIEQNDLWEKLILQLAAAKNALALPLLLQKGEPCDYNTWLEVLQTIPNLKSKVVYEALEKITNPSSPERIVFCRKCLNLEISAYKYLFSGVLAKIKECDKIDKLRTLFIEFTAKPHPADLDMLFIETLLDKGECHTIVLSLIISDYPTFKGPEFLPRLLIICKRVIVFLKNNHYSDLRDRFQLNIASENPLKLIFISCLIGFLEIIEDLSREMDVIDLLTEAMPLFIDFGTYNESCFSYRLLQRAHESWTLELLASFWEMFISTKLRLALNNNFLLTPKSELTFFIENRHRLMKGSTEEHECFVLAIQNYCQFLCKTYVADEDREFSLKFLELLKEKDFLKFYLVNQLIHAPVIIPPSIETVCTMIATHLIHLKKMNHIPDEHLVEQFDQFIYLSLKYPLENKNTVQKYAKSVVQNCTKNNYFTPRIVAKWSIFLEMVPDFEPKYIYSYIDLFFDLHMFNNHQLLPRTLEILRFIQSRLFTGNISILKKCYSIYFNIFEQVPDAHIYLKDLIPLIDTSLNELYLHAQIERKEKFVEPLNKTWKKIKNRLSHL